MMFQKCINFYLLNNMLMGIYIVTIIKWMVAFKFLLLKNQIIQLEFTFFSKYLKSYLPVFELELDKVCYT